LKGKETAKLYGVLIVIVLAIGQALACHKEGVTTVEVKIVRIVIAQKQVNVQTVKDNIKFLRHARACPMAKTITIKAPYNFAVSFPFNDNFFFSIC
jgi:hypothetical protein